MREGDNWSGQVGSECFDGGVQERQGERENEGGSSADAASREAVGSAAEVRQESTRTRPKEGTTSHLIQTESAHVHTHGKIEREGGGREKELEIHPSRGLNWEHNGAEQRWKR